MFCFSDIEAIFENLYTQALADPVAQIQCFGFSKYHCFHFGDLINIKHFDYDAIQWHQSQVDDEFPALQAQEYFVFLGME